MARDDRRYVLVEREGGSSLWWFLAGSALGAGLALLFAPQSGDRTRRVVGRKLGKLRDAADAALDDMRETLSPAHRPNRSLADAEAEEDEETADAEAEAGDHGDRVESPRRGGSRSARRELEQRLAEARARRQRAMADEDEEPVA